MLVFTRRRHQAIMIGDGIQVRVLRVGKDGVRLGIVAPPKVQVHRQEIYDQIREANQAAVAAPAEPASVAERLRTWVHSAREPR
jgi:carbon storage regulator